MKTSNAIKKAEKRTGKKATVNGNVYRFVLGNEYLEFSKNGSYDEITCINTGNLNDPADAMIDYFPQIWHDNISQALRFLGV